MEKIKCFQHHCSECGKRLHFFSGYIHPVERKKKCVCQSCWEKLNQSQNNYYQFIRDSLKEQKGLYCYVLINTVPRSEKQVYNTLSHLDGIEEVQPLLGKHDILVKFQANNFTDLTSFLISKVRTIKGVRNTQTLTGTFSLTGIQDKRGS